MTEDFQNKANQHRPLEKGEAFDLYVHRISHNLAALLQQLVLLRGIVDGKQEPPTTESRTSTEQ